jgi:hypothetical protein
MFYDRTQRALLTSWSGYRSILVSLRVLPTRFPALAELTVTRPQIHGLTIPFFTLGRRVHSISRTWTQGTTNNEPSWLSRVKRIGDDDDEEKVVRGEGEELGRTESGEMGTEKATPVDSARTLEPEEESGQGYQKDGDAAREDGYDEMDDIRAEGKKEKGDTDETEIWQEGDKVRCLYALLKSQF